MNSRYTRAICLALILAGLSIPGWAWGPRTQSAIVNAAAGVLTSENIAPLANVSKYILRGAAVPTSTLIKTLPGADTDPVEAVESEMLLLQAVREGRVDPYYAYRLGMLGRLVAELASPLAASTETYRGLYESDVEKAVERTALKTQPRQVVDPRAYFTRIQAHVEAQRPLIEKDYESGQGIGGVAGAGLSETLSMSVNAVADVWYTILGGDAVLSSVSDARVRQYHLNAVEFYLKQDSTAGAEASYSALEQHNLLDTATQREIGDLYYAAGKRERAVTEYEKVARQDPGQREVAERIAAFYLEQGTQALEKGELEAARDMFGEAARADRVNPAGTAAFLETESRIAERETRLQESKAALNAAQELVNEAVRNAERGAYAPAMAQLRQARDKYTSVSPDFPQEQRDAEIGLDTVSELISDYRQKLIAEAQDLSGSGGSLYLQDQALNRARQVDQSALQTYLQQQYKREVDRLRREAGTTAAGE